MQQDILALAIAALAAVWLARSLMQRLVAPPCQPPSVGPSGADGFVPLDALTPAKQSGRPKGRPRIQALASR